MLPAAFFFNTMRLPAAVLPWFVMTAAALAQPAEPPQPAEAPGAAAREVALDNLLSERGSAKELEAVIAAARKSGISDQAILEARFLYHVDRSEDDAIAALLPEFLKQREGFKITDSAIFSVKEDWLAVVEYVQAIAALRKGDKDAFKTHITEAFWLSPSQASAFAPHIDRLRLEEAMRGVRIDFETRLAALGGGDAVALKSLLEGRKAMILHFWSPASRECEASMPDYAATARALEEKGIAMVSILPEDAPQILTDARAMILPLGDKPPGAWLVDRRENPLARELRVRTLPAFAVISNDGRVLFNGEPADDGLWDALTKIDPRISRPASPGEAE